MTSILSSWCQFTHQTDNWAVIPKNFSNRDLTDSLPFNTDLQPRIMYPCIVSLLFVIILTTPESRDVKESYGTQLKIQMKQNCGYMRQLETKQNKACSFALTFSAYGPDQIWFIHWNACQPRPYPFNQLHWCTALPLCLCLWPGFCSDPWGVERNDIKHRRNFGISTKKVDYEAMGSWCCLFPKLIKVSEKTSHL